MADSATRSFDTKNPKSPAHRSKVVRSQKITAPSTTTESRSHRKDKRRTEEDDDDQDEEDDDDVPERSAVPRSHTPGHLSTKSQDRRRKPSELSIRQRSQSASQASLHSSSKPPKTPLSSTSTSSLAPKPPPSMPPGKHATEAESAPTSADARDRDSRRPMALRSTSAIAGRPTPGPTPSRTASTVHSSSVHSYTRAPPQRGQFTAFPPLQDPKTAPDVPPAPASGMYWSRAPVSGAPHTSLRAHTTTLVGSNIFVFGGCDSRACFNELYVFDADAFYWSAPHVVGDIPVPLRAMTATAVGKKLIVFGGGDGPAYYNDVYVLDTTTFRWSRPRILGDSVPSKRRAHTACLYKNGLYIFGGGDGVRALNDIWRLDVSDVNKMSWRLVSSPDKDKPASAPPPRPKARGYHTANMVGSKLIIYGGSDGGECFNDVWVYDVDAQAWRLVDIPVTYRRLSHTATLVGSYLFIIGGHDGNEYANDVLLLNLVTMSWDRRRVYGLPPSGRGYHGTVLYDSRLFTIGGFDGSEVFGDVWILELAVHAYYSQISHFTIEV
ncbi:hypothetical protein BN1708_006239, partial [Verticillium longisporum]